MLNRYNTHHRPCAVYHFLRPSNLERKRVQFVGAVQGVGFRPFVHKLAVKLNICGYVANTTAGATVEAQGTESALDRFLECICNEPPPLAKPQIRSVTTIPIEPGADSFVIGTSQIAGGKTALITADTASCQDCLRELADPNDRRYRYPFINCTNCGPRYTIIFDTPYDRVNTTMSKFEMCADCLAEYRDPAGRRFHAQPNACAVCGPSVWLCDNRGERLAGRGIDDAIELLEQGHIVAVKGLGGFHLAVRADDDSAVEKLRQRKYRKAKPFAVMVRNLESAAELAHIDEAGRDILTSAARPIVLCRKRLRSPLSPAVADGSPFWGIMLPYTPLHTLLMRGRFAALVMTSANNTDDPLESDNAVALERLGGIADFFLMHDREIYTRCDDSIVRGLADRPSIIRRGRGYVPQPITVRRCGKADILAVGAELKNTITYLKDDCAYVSQHIGDLVGLAGYENFERTLTKLGALIDATPTAIACDMHPSMLSSTFAAKYSEKHNVPLVRVQHHHAHIAAVIGEYDLPEPLVGLSCDGVGYASDGTVWGCELMTAWRGRFERAGHMETLPMPGGDAASKEPWRMAISCLISTYGYQEGLALAKKLLNVENSKIETIGQMIQNNVNTPLTSSLGRLFDGVAAMIGLCSKNTYDAQAAITLENSCTNVHERARTGRKRAPAGSYRAEIGSNEHGLAMKITPFLREIAEDVLNKKPPEQIAEKFHNTIINQLASMARTLAKKLNVDIVALGGGVFQNDRITTGLTNILQQEGFNVYVGRKLPPNDGAISFGQAIVADERIKKI